MNSKTNAPPKSESTVKVIVYAWARTVGAKVWYRVLRFVDLDGARQEILVRPEDAHSTKLISLLESRGARLPTDKAARRRLCEDIVNADPRRRILLVERPGWIDDSKFMLGPDVIGEGGEEVRLGDRLGQHRARIAKKGSLDGWKSGIRKPCEASSYLVFALSTGFAAPLLRLTNVENGGFHFWGPSTKGKSSLLQCVATIFGGADEAEIGYMRSWRVTSTAGDEMSLGHCDLPLVLDEVKLLDPDPVIAARRASEVAYSITSGVPKSRSRRYDSEIPEDLKQYRVLLLSAGELSLERQAISGGSRRLRGEEARLIDIPVPDGTGILDRLPKATRGAARRQVIEDLKDACARSFGTAGQRFVEQLVQQFTKNPEELRLHLSRWIRLFLKKATVDLDDPYEVRFARRFSLAYAAAILAIGYEVVPWDPNLALRSIRRIYRRARGQRARTNNSVSMAAERVIRRVCKATPINLDGVEKAERQPFASEEILQMRHLDGSTLRAIEPTFFRKLVGSAVSARAVADHLESEGILVPRPNGRRTRQIAVPGGTKRHDYYCLREDRLPHRGTPVTRPRRQSRS